MPDWIIKQNEVSPAYAATLTYSNGEVVDLEGAEELTFVMRSPAAGEPLKLQGTAAIQHPKEGKVIFEPEPADTAQPGLYLATWTVVLAGQEVPMSFPTDGYLVVEIEGSLSAKGGQTLVGLPEVIDHMNIPVPDRVHDAKLQMYVKAVAPLIEEHTGPILPQLYDEWYEGGHSTISLPHKPSYGYGTDPVCQLMAVSEYRGPIEYNLAIVPTPTQGTVYSTMLNAELGTIVRRTAGGGTYPFWSDPEHPQQSVHVVYYAGQATVPENVKFAAFETIRWWYQTTEAVGRGGRTRADEETERPMVALPYHVVAMLGPTRRHPSFA